MADTLNIIITTKHEGTGAADAKKGIDGIVQAAKVLAASGAVKQIIQYTAELTQLGATAQRQATALDNLAQAAGESGDDITAAIREASDFTIDRMTAMQAANRAMILEVADSPEQFERLTRVAVSLGRAMGQDAAKSIDDFVVAAGRQSEKIADNLGLLIKAEDAYARYAAANNITVEEMDDAAKKQAFLTEMLRQGEQAMGALGDSALDNAAKIEQAKSTWQTFMSIAGEGFADALLGSVGSLEGFNRALDDHGDKLRSGMTYVIQQYTGLYKLTDAIDAVRGALQGSEQAVIAAADGQRYLSGEIERTIPALEKMNPLTFEARRYLEELALEESFADDAIRSTASGIDYAVVQFEKLAQAEREAMEVAQQHSEYLFEASMSFTDFYRRQEESAEDFNKRVEEAEAKHQEKLAKLAEQGQGQAVRLNVAAEEEKLAALQRNLEIALQQQSEFTEKTKQSTQMRKSDQISSLQGQIAEQETLLDNYHAGRLVKAGRNVDGLIEEENRRYAEEVEGLKASRAEQEAEQKRSLGRMVLQHFTSWAQMQGLTAEETLQMQLDISEKYGLIEEDAARHVEGMANTWQAELNVMRGESLAFTSAVKDHIESIPSAKTVTITYKTVGSSRETEEPISGPILEQQHGTPYFPGGMALVGERGPELVRLPRGSAVYPASRTAGMLGGGVNIGPVYIQGESPEMIWRKLENYARLKGKSGWQQLGR